MPSKKFISPNAPPKTPSALYPPKPTGGIKIGGGKHFSPDCTKAKALYPKGKR